MRLLAEWEGRQGGLLLGASNFGALGCGRGSVGGQSSDVGWERADDPGCNLATVPDLSAGGGVLGERGWYGAGGGVHGDLAHGAGIAAGGCAAESLVSSSI